MVLGLGYPLLLNTSVPYWVCFWVIVLQGSGSVISYLVQGKYNMLLRVDNRNYVTTNLGTVTSVLTDASRIFLLLQGRSIIAVQTTYLIFNLIKNVFYKLLYKKELCLAEFESKTKFSSDFTKVSSICSSNISFGF